MSGVVRLVLLAALVAAAALLILPGLASADPAVADEVVATAPTGPATTTDPVTTTDPTAEAPADPAPTAGEPVTEVPTGEAAPPPAAGETPPAETESTPTPAPAPSVAETVPPPSASPLPGTPDAPRPMVEPDKIPVALLAPVQKVAPAVPTAAAVVPAIGASIPDAPAAPPAAPAARPVATPAVAPAVAAPPASALHEEFFPLDPAHRAAPVAAVAPTPIPQGLGRLGDEGTSALFSEAVEAPIGTVTSGSSLLAVLAGYVLPGVAGPPASTIIMFVLVGLIVAIARAPRPQLSERAFAGLLVGAASGHGQGVQRPG